MEVVNEGWLEKGLQLGSKKEWKKRYFVLKRASGSNSQTIEYYKDKDWRKQDPKGVFNLLPGYHVSSIDDLQKKRFYFEIKTIDSSLLLAASTEASRQSWTDVLNANLTVKSFAAVLISSPESAAKFTENIKGPVLLQITDSAVVLSCVHTCNISWQFGCIRRYKCNHGIFILEVGRKSMTGEGTFEFNTNDPQELFRALDTVLKDRIRSKGLGAGASDSSDQKPPSLPSHIQELKRLPSLKDNSNPPPLPLERRQSSLEINPPSPLPYDIRRSSTMGRSQPPPLPLERKRPSNPEPRSPPAEYSHLSLSKSPDVSSLYASDGYDHLSGAASRLVQKRCSDSGILVGEKKVLHATRSVQCSPAPTAAPVEEEYMDMASAKEITKASMSQQVKKQQPLPPSRSSKPAIHAGSLTSDVTYDSIRDAESLDESYYNTPSAFTFDTSRSEDHALEYDELDHTDQRPVAVASSTEYNHLNEAVALRDGRTELELYDTPTRGSVASNVAPVATTNAVKTSAQKAPPSIPTSKLKVGEDHHSSPRQSGLSSPGDSQSGESGGSQSSLEQQDLYDTPRSSLLMEAYDVPASGSLASPKKATPAKPVRHPSSGPDRPKPPAPPRNKSDADIVSKLKRNLELSGFKPSIPGAARPITGHGLSAHDMGSRLSEPGFDPALDDGEQAVYDSPASLPADGYNRVDDVVSGQYGGGLHDDQGYAQLPDSHDNGVYQYMRSDL